MPKNINKDRNSLYGATSMCSYTSVDRLSINQKLASLKLSSTSFWSSVVQKDSASAQSSHRGGSISYVISSIPTSRLTSRRRESYVK